MNIVHYKAQDVSKIAFCLVDTLHTVSSLYARELVKNQSDFTISNLYIKGYDVFQGVNEDQLLQHVSTLDFTHAVVFATGTEFINGMSFFEAVKELVKTDFFIAGHILDRDDAYYELHQQCYIINLDIFKLQGMPCIGKQELGAQHTQEEPVRSDDNYHDFYTPTTVNKGCKERQYKHKCHGWNILSIAFAKDLPIVVFDDTVRNSKRHHYPESNKDWLEALQWIYYRERYCSTEHIHTKNNEWSSGHTGSYQQVVLPASGTLYFELLAEGGTVVFYDYNTKALDYWREHAPKGINYKFIHLDVIGQEPNLADFIDPKLSTFVNLSNLFCYEGTTMLSSLEYRVYKENQLLTNLAELVPHAYVNFTIRAASGFIELPMKGNIVDIGTTDIKKLRKPTWHTTSWLDS